jgi:hypothetical protein
MDNIMDNQWNRGLNLTLEEYETDNSTSDDFPSNFDWEIFDDRPNFKMMGLAFGLVFGVAWPGLLLLLFRLFGYIFIGLTFGYGREFANATFFQWADEVAKNVLWALDQGGCFWYPFYVTSVTLGCIVGRLAGSEYVLNHANFLKESNMTWAEILVEKQAIIDNEFMSQIIAIVLLVFFLIMFSASVCSKVCTKRNRYAQSDVALGQESEIPFSNEESQTPNSNQEFQTPNSSQESQNPNSNQEYQTPISSNQESQTNEECYEQTFC